MIDIAIVKTGWEFIKKMIPDGGLPHAWEWFSKGSPQILRLLVILFILLSIIFSTVAWQDISATKDVLINALKSPLEASPHPDTAIEAMLLASVLRTSGVDEKTTSLSNSKVQPKISKAFKDDLDLFQRNVDLPKSSETMAKSAATFELDILDNDPSEGINGKVFTDQSPGFLFISGKLMHEFEQSVTSEKFTLKKADNQALFSDISRSQNLSTFLCKDLKNKYAPDSADKVSIFDDLPQAQLHQAYVIFSSGVSRLCETDVNFDWKSQRQYYSDKLPSTTSLNDRPYFEQTLLRKSTSGEYWTTPYIDLGGNGIVRTFCKYIKAPPDDGVLCFDFSVQGEIKDSIRALAGRFGGSIAEFDCENGRCSLANDLSHNGFTSVLLPNVLHPATELTEEETKAIQRKFSAASNRNAKALFFGRVTVLDNEPADVDVVLLPTGENHVLAIKLDISRYEWWRNFWLLLALISIASFGLSLFLIFVDYGMKVREQERAFNAVDTVMSDVPAPYARVDENGIFIRVNDAFARLVGYNSAAEALPELQKYKYQDFIAGDESKEEYARIKRERQEGQVYRSYLVNLWSGQRPGVGPITRVKVHGGDVPTPHASRNKPGQSFGILLRTEIPRPIAISSDRTDSEITEQSA